MAEFCVPIKDYGDENTKASFPVADAVLDADLTALFNAVDAVIIGAIGQSELVTRADKDAGPGGLPASQYAQREMKWLCSYHDATTLKARHLEIGTADAAQLAGNSGALDLTAGVGATLKTEFEDAVVDRDTGNAVILDSVVLVGRNT